MNRKNQIRIICLLGMMTAIGCVPAKQEEKTAAVIPYAAKKTTYAVDQTTEVLLDAPEVASDEIDHIIKHGDHWHVFTKDGREIITYKDPSKATTTQDLKDTVSLISSEALKENVSGNEVVRILKHGDHWHIYTADGGEYITHDDPSGIYPRISIGTYTGTHGDTKPKNGNLMKPDNQTHPEKEPEKTKPSDKLAFIPVVSLEELAKLPIERILKHEDHWHAYTKDNREYITNHDPSGIFPKIKIGTYTGKHGGSDQPDPNSVIWPEGIDRIVDHGDHWHLYRNGEEVLVVTVNPKDHYPEAEYIVDHVPDHSDIIVGDDELFDVYAVAEELNRGIAQKVNLTDLKNMTDYGDIPEDGLPVFGSDGQRTEVFFWLHGNHYHAYSLKQLIRDTKAGKYGDVSAKEVVATVKYMMNHKGESFEASVTVDRFEIIRYLMSYYKIEDKYQIFDLGNQVTVYNADYSHSISVHMSIFRKENDVISTETPLPELKEAEKKDESAEEDKREPEKEETEEKELVPDQEMSEAEVIAKYSALYGLSEDQFIDALFEIDGATLLAIEFHEDGTAVFNGVTYNYIELARKSSGFEEEAKEMEETVEPEFAEPKEEIREEEVQPVLTEETTADPAEESTGSDEVTAESE